MVGFALLNQTPKEEKARIQRVNDSIYLVEAQKRLEAEQKRNQHDTLQVAATVTPVQDSLKRVNELGAFADASNGEEKFFYLFQIRILDM